MVQKKLMFVKQPSHAKAIVTKFPALTTLLQSVLQGKSLF
jgi:hypothetical protein